MSKPKIILLHGWLFNSNVWSSFREKLENDFISYTPDLPGYGNNKSLLTNDSYLDNFISNLNSKCIIVGWSYGGLLALKRMSLNKNIQKTILINSYFPAQNQFINSSSIDQLINNLNHNRDRTIKNFVYECCRSSLESSTDKKNLNEIARICGYPSNKTLINNLEEMKIIYSKINFSNIDSNNVCILKGDNDHFGNHNTYQFMNNIITIKNMGHLPFYSSSENVINQIKYFIKGK